MNTAAKWVGNGYGYPQRWALKRDIPQMSPGIVPIKLEFRWEIAWSVMDQEKRILFRTLEGEDKWLPTWEFWLVGFGRVIGPQDFTAAENTPMHEAWRAASTARRTEQFYVWIADGPGNGIKI